MNLRKKLFIFPILLSVFFILSCSNNNPPFEELGGTRWNGTNISSGVLIDIQFGPIGTYDVSMTFYLDSRPYEERNQTIDTTGNRMFGMTGLYFPIEKETYNGDIVYGYKWGVYLIKDDGSEHTGGLKYDNKIMFFLMDGYSWPMTQVN